MEAALQATVLGFDVRTPPALNFRPTEAEIFVYYLFLRALGLPHPPFAHDVLEDDPCSLPPEDLLAKHGYAGSHQGFFLDTTDVSKNAGRRDRVVRGKGGGLWQGQKSRFRTVTLLRFGGGGMDIQYKRYELTYKFKADGQPGEAETDSGEGKRKRKRKGSAKDGDPTGWVMHQYQIVSPALQSTVLSHIKKTAARIKKDQMQAAAAAQHPEQPGASFEVPDPKFGHRSLPPSLNFDRLPPALKVGRTDDDVAAHYLLLRALGFPHPPFAHSVIVDDPYSLPPQDLLAKHGHDGHHHAFFLDTTDVSKNAGRRDRVVRGNGGGLWQGQKSSFRTVTLLRFEGSDIDIQYKRYHLTYKAKAQAGEADTEIPLGKRKRRTTSVKIGDPTGWVMHEYQVVSPPLQSTALSHIKMTAAKKKKDRLQATAAQQVLELRDPGYELPAKARVPELASPSHQALPTQEQTDSRWQVFPVQELSVLFDEQPKHNHPAMVPMPELASPSHQALPIQEQPDEVFPVQELSVLFDEQPQSCYGHPAMAPMPELASPSHQVLPLQEQPDPRWDVFPVQELSGWFEEQPQSCYDHPDMAPVPELASPSHQVLPVQGQPGTGGGSGQADAPLSGMGEFDCSLYLHDCGLDFRHFGGEWELSPIKSQLGYFQSILGV